MKPRYEPVLNKRSTLIPFLVSTFPFRLNIFQVVDGFVFGTLRI